MRIRVTPAMTTLCAAISGCGPNPPSEPMRRPTSLATLFLAALLAACSSTESVVTTGITVTSTVTLQKPQAVAGVIDR